MDYIPVTPEVAAAIERRYTVDNKIIAVIAREFGFSYYKTRRILQLRKVTFRKLDRTKRQVTPDDIKRMVALYTSGMSIRQVSVSVDRSYSTVHRYLLEAGVPFRERGGGKRK